MALFSGINIAVQVYLLAIALLYVRQKDKLARGMGYQMWKQLAVCSLIPLGMAIYIYASATRLALPLFLTLSIETDAIATLILTIFYFRPRQIQDGAFQKMSSWKLITIFTTILAVLCLFIPMLLAP